MKLQTLACLVLVILVAALATAQQNPSSPGLVRSGATSPGLVDWAQFHFDPALTGYNPFETILSPANVGNVTPKWSYAPSEGWGVTGAPAVANGVMYFGLAFTGGNDRSHDGVNSFAWAVYALDATTGAFLWKYETEPIFGSPAVANGRVYVIDADYLSALDAGTGALIWQYDVPGQAQYCSPTIVNNILYFTDPGKNVYALNATNGAFMWKYATAAANWAPPAVANGIVYVNGGTGTVSALNANTGALIWSKQLGGSLGPPRILAGTLAGQTVANGVLYVGIQTKPNFYDLYALDATTGTIIWRKALASLYMETPAVANGVVYVVSGGMVYALDASTGAVVWQVQGDGNSPIVANGVVYTGAWEGTGEGTGYGLITARDAGTGATLWNYQTDSTAGYNGLFPSPVVVNGTIFGSRSSLGVSQVGAWSLTKQ